VTLLMTSRDEPAQAVGAATQPSHRSGDSSTRVDYHEYREVAGVKLPSRLDRSVLDVDGGRSHYELTERRAERSSTDRALSRDRTWR
jgi:hypothetical protein